MSKFVYLAGAISGLTWDQANWWRDYATSIMKPWGIDTINPLRGKDFLQTQGKIEGTYEHPLATSKGIVTRDRNDVKRSDLVLFNMDPWLPYQIGTLVEVGWADAWGKPIVMIFDPRNDRQNHAFLQELSGFIVPTIEEAASVIKDILLP